MHCLPPERAEFPGYSVTVGNPRLTTSASVTLPGDSKRGLLSVGFRMVAGLARHRVAQLRKVNTFNHSSHAITLRERFSTLARANKASPNTANPRAPTRTPDHWPQYSNNDPTTAKTKPRKTQTFLTLPICFIAVNWNDIFIGTVRYAARITSQIQPIAPNSSLPPRCFRFSWLHLLERKKENITGSSAHTGDQEHDGGNQNYPESEGIEGRRVEQEPA